MTFDKHLNVYFKANWTTDFWKNLLLFFSFLVNKFGFT